MPQEKKRTKRRSRRSFLTSLSIDQLTAEIARRRDLLMARRAEMEAELEAVTAEMATFYGFGAGGGSPRRRGPGRPRGTGAPTAQRRGRGGNEKSLASVLHSILQGRTMTVQEMAEAAKKAGHKTRSKNFQKVVSLTLLKSRKMFRRVVRGQYTSK